MNGKLWGWLVGLESLVFMLLEGSMFTLGILVAPQLFKTIESRDLAGRVFGNILGVWLWVGLACLLVLTATAVISLARTRPLSRLLLGRLLTTVVMLGLVGAFGLVLARINTIQAGLTAPIDTYPTDANPRLEFDQLHKLSTNLLSVALGLGLVWFGLSLTTYLKLKTTRSSPAQPQTQPQQELSRI